MSDDIASLRENVQLGDQRDDIPDITAQIKKVLIVNLNEIDLTLRQ